MTRSDDNGMDDQKANRIITERLMFRLLPNQILLAAVSTVNGIVSSFFASNYIGIDAMSAVGLFGPIMMLLYAISTMLAGGSAILCGKYLGQNQQEKLRNMFSLDLILSVCIAALFTVLFIVCGLMDLTGFFTRDDAVRPIFNSYLLGQAFGVMPFMLGSQLPAFLLMENKGKRTMAASLLFIAVNLALNVLFVQVFRMEAFGLALASSLGMWVFFGVQASYFIFGGSHLRITAKRLCWRECRAIVRVGLPGALSSGYQAARGLFVNTLVQLFVGTAGISAFAAANNLLSVFWAVPAGMLAVSRLVMSVSIGEEDRQTLTDVMRVMFRRFIPLMCGISVILIFCAVPLTRLFFRDPAEAVYPMTVWGMRFLPLCMPLTVICTHFVCYGQITNRQSYVQILSLLDGVVCVAGFTALLIRPLGMNSVYIANILNGVVCALAPVIYSLYRRKQFPRCMDELMVIPDDFGVSEGERMDLTVRTMEEVVSIAQRVQRFCEEKGIDKRRAYLSGLAMEEMAGNIIYHGFTKDTKKHTVDVRVVHKDDDVILRLKDDCVPFNPGERQNLAEGKDILKNVGIRMVFRIAKDIQYQNMMGLNVLTLRF